MNKLLRLRIVEQFDNQANFACALGVCESVVSRVVQGRKVLSVEDQNTWARLLDTTPETLGWEVHTRDLEVHHDTNT